MTHNEYMELKEIYEKEGQSLSWSLANVLRDNRYADKSTLIATAYVLLKANDEAVNVDSLDDFCTSVGANENRKAFLESAVGDAWSVIAGQRHRYGLNALKAVILFGGDREERFRTDYKTSDSLIWLAEKLFSFTEDDTIADFGMGCGSFLIDAFLRNPTMRLYGLDINASAKEIAAIRMEIVGGSAVLEHKNIFELDPGVCKHKKIFSNYPFGVRMKEVDYERYSLAQKIIQDVKGISKGGAADWFFNMAIMECLDDDGKGIAIMASGGSWNLPDRAARKYFVDNGYIEAVIALPDRMFDSVGASTMMIVFSRNNAKTMLVDATGMCEKGRRFNSFTDEHIENIVKAVGKETDHSRFVSKEEFAENDYVINPTRYLTEKVEVENGQPFESIIKSITRGAQIPASELDGMVSKEPTDCQYLMLGNIQRGKIDKTLPYIKGIEDNQKKYCLKNHSLILSKNGAPFKVAVAEIREDMAVLANGNLYIVEVDEEKADPYYVKAFLESEKGTALLKSITVGATIPNISMEALKKLPIPIVPLEEQRTLMQKYLAKLDEIELYERKLQKAYEELGHIFDEG